MTKQEKWMEMVNASRDAVEDFNDFADDKAIIFAAGEIDQLRAEMERLTRKHKNQMRGAKSVVTYAKKQQWAAEEQAKVLRKALTKLKNRHYSFAIVHQTAEQALKETAMKCDGVDIGKLEGAEFINCSVTDTSKTQADQTNDHHADLLEHLDSKGTPEQLEEALEQAEK